MKIPRYWQRETASGDDARGRRFTAHGWGWSEHSVDEARDRAAATARRVLDWLVGGRQTDIANQYGYDERLPREEIIEEYVDVNGQPNAFVSRNAYGSLILNMRDLMFIDIDLPAQPKPSAVGFFAKLIGVNSRDALDVADKTLAEVRKTTRRYQDLGFRVYRTFAGYRVMIASEPLLPDSPRSQELLQAFRSDPLYVRMCKNQQCFRARLTPKPWRCRLPKPPGRFPFSETGTESAYRQWEQKYIEGTRNFRTCEFVESIGTPRLAPELKELVELHDQLCRTQADARLA